MKLTRCSIVLSASIALASIVAIAARGTEFKIAQAESSDPDAAPPRPRQPAPKPAPRKPEPKPKPAAQAPAPTPAAPAQPSAATPAQAVELQPLLHARGNGVTACLDGINKASRTVIDSTHTAISTWSTSTPDQHIFGSVVSLTYPNRIAPRAAAFLVAAPQAGGCDTSTVQIFPTGRTCAAIQQDLARDSQTIADLSGLPLIKNKAGMSHLLLPTAGNGCVIVAISIEFGGK